MPKLSKQDRKEAEAIVANIRRRPAFHLARVYIERVRRNYGADCFGKRDEFQNGWAHVDRAAAIMTIHTGAHVLEETLLVELEASGFKVRAGRLGAETNLADRVLLNAWRATEFGTKTRRQVPDLSDPTDAQTGMH